MVKLFLSLFTVISFSTFLSGCDDSGTEPKSKIGNITKPSAGHKVLTKGDIVITWDGAATQVDVTGSLTGTNFTPLTPTATGAGTLTIKAPTAPSDNYTIKLTNKEDASDVSSVAVAVKAIILTDPKAGQAITKGSEVDISWLASDDWISGVVVKVSTNNGSCYRMLNEAGSWDKGEDFPWKVGQEPPGACQLQYPSTQVLVRVAEYTNETGTGMSDVSGTLSVNN